MDLLLATAQEGLNSLVRQLWGIAQQRQCKSDFPLRIIDDPETVRTILNDINTFRKNYAFLDSLSKGRFSDNGQSWSARTHLTQPQYSKNHFLKHTDAAQIIYRAEFNRLQTNATVEDIGEAAVAAAVKIVGQVFGLPDDIPWDTQWATRVRIALVKRQWIGFGGATQAQLDAIDFELRGLREQCASIWKKVPSLQNLLENFRSQAIDIPDFDPVQELIQNIIASSETTAATIMWAATILACRQDLQGGLRSQQISVENFIQELLRLYPAVPFITRYAEQSSVIGKEIFNAGDAFIISIFGLHYSNFWTDPLVFNPDRFNQDLCLRDHYMPFLIGARTCGGRKLAELELRVAIPALLEKFTLSIKDPAKVYADYGLSFRPGAPDLFLRVR
ncbi:MAG: hypothetical protein B0W54_06745 [Cellvibrio sp. 79]|nr:MAG: hypothetical protein B0W54_06745 [Cellvibrio sp. 79]